MIHGLLIEGTDYVGKTTVCSLVAHGLAEHGVATHVGHCYVHEHRLLERLREDAKRSGDLLEIDWYYSANILLDIESCRRGLPREFVVQDRHWLSQVGRNEFFHGAGTLPTELIEARHLPFEFNFYLKSNFAAKCARSALRPPKSVRDEYLRKYPERHQQYDEFLERRLPPSERWQVIDTSDFSPLEVAGQITTVVLRALGRERRMEAVP